MITYIDVNGLILLLNVRELMNYCQNVQHLELKYINVKIIFLKCAWAN